MFIKNKLYQDANVSGTEDSRERRTAAEWENLGRKLSDKSPSLALSISAF